MALLQGDVAAARARLDAYVAVWRELVGLPSMEQQARQGLMAGLTFLIATLQIIGDTAAREPLLAEWMAVGETLDEPRA